MIYADAKAAQVRMDLIEDMIDRQEWGAVQALSMDLAQYIESLRIAYPNPNPNEAKAFSIASDAAFKAWGMATSRLDLR